MKSLQSRKYSIAALLAIIAVLSFSTKAVFVKLAYQHEVEKISLLLLRMVFSLPFFVIVAFCTIRKSKGVTISKKQLLTIIFLGFIGYYLSSYLDFAGLTYISASLERLVLFIYPVFVLILNRIVNKTTISKAQMIASVISYVGLILIFHDGIVNFQLNHDLVLGASLVLMSAFTYASYLVGNQRILSNMNPVVFNSLVQIVSTTFVVIHFFVTPEASVTGLPLEVYGYGALMAVVSTIIPSYLLAYAIKQIGASNVAIFGGLGPVSTIILSIVFLKESMSTLQWIGGSIILVGVMTLVFIKNKTQKEL